METPDEGGKRGERQKPVKLDRSATGRIRLVVDGEDGHSGIGTLARRVQILDEETEKLRIQRDNERQVVEGMRARSGDFIGSLQALFTRAIAKLQTTEENLVLREAEMSQQSRAVYEGIGAIEEIIDEYAKGEKQYLAAEQIQKILQKMKMLAGICETVLQSIARLGKSGEAQDVARARELFARNVSALQQMVGEYGEQIGKNPRWTGDVHHDFPALIARGNFGEVKKQSDDESSALNGKMDDYVDEIKRNLPDNLGALLTNEKKEYFKQRTHASSDEHTDIPESNS